MAYDLHARIGKLVITDKGKYSSITASCDCGRTWKGRTIHLKNGVDRCGSCQREAGIFVSKATGIKVQVGAQFTDWLVLSLSDESRPKRLKWLCRCKCGTEAVVWGENLRKGGSKRCADCGNTARRMAPGTRIWSGVGEISYSWWKAHVEANRPGKRVLEISITMQEAWDLFLAQERSCALSGLPLVLSSSPYENTASLDRRDSSLGYTLGNTQWLHKHVNMVKNTYDQDYFIDLCNLVAGKHPRVLEGIDTDYVRSPMVGGRINAIDHDQDRTI